MEKIGLLMDEKIEKADLAHIKDLDKEKLNNNQKCAISFDKTF